VLCRILGVSVEKGEENPLHSSTERSPKGTKELQRDDEIIGMMKSSGA